MQNPTSALFRPEIMEHRAERLHGEVSLVTPLSWQIIGGLLFTGLIVATGFLACGTYSRVETVSGAVTLDKGVAQIVPSRAGLVDAVLVANGAVVRAGTPLVRIRSEEAMAAGRSVPARIERAIDDQDTQLSNQSALLLRAAGEEQQRLAAQAAGLASEIRQIDSQISDQKRLVEVAQAEFKDIGQLVDRGFISKRDMAVRETTLLSRQQQLAQFQQLRASKLAEIASARRSAAQSQADAQAQAASTAANRAALSQHLAEVEQTRGYVLTAPFDGTITAVTARTGQPADAGRPLMLILPANAQTRVELQVPTSAVGFIARGQPMRIAIDAYPYQRFGTIDATVSDISDAGVTRIAANGSATIAYPVIATMRAPSIVAYGRVRRLLPGMTLTARIVTERRSLLEWLFDPIFAVRNR